MVSVYDIAAKRAVVDEQRKHLRGWEAWALEAVRGGLQGPLDAVAAALEGGFGGRPEAPP